jgi:hypothetical protein
VNQTLVLFSGKAGVGKTTSACYASEYAYRKLFLNSKVFSFAHGVKECARNYFLWNGEKDAHGRDLLQRVGKFGREINPNNWVDYLLTDYYEYPDINIGFVDDCRFMNEIEVPKNFLTVYTIRIESPEREILKGTPAYDDLSEISLPSGPNVLYDFIVWNTGTKEDLKKAIEQIVSIIVDKENE